ncbi:hypothetical protein C8J35_1305 [Rhizobium sp. PP-F2F-G38]|nr:hypothetical protein C8J35_1305 [Rhizobium sp. PP-F2F-G38]
MSVFRLAALPAREGDCLVLSWGPSESELSHMVIDAGHTETAHILLGYLRKIGARRIELVVVTHVDADHIEGMLDFLPIARAEFEIGEVWFNGYRHLRDDLEGMGPVQGERLTEMLADMPWNLATDRRAVRTADDGAPRLVKVIDGLHITVVSPDAEKLKAMVNAWEKAVRDAGLEPGRAKDDSPPPAGLEVLGGDIDTLAATKTGKDLAKANGTSIAFLAEYDGKSILLASDAHPGILEHGLKTMADGKRLPVDLFKVSHHGSQNNVTRELLKLVDCRRFLVSTDGTKFGHPDPVAIARIVDSRDDGVKLLFNYRQPRTEDWANRPEAGHRYECVFPDAGKPLVVDV